jgi:hypothetical protein
MHGKESALFIPFASIAVFHHVALGNVGLDESTVIQVAFPAVIVSVDLNDGQDTSGDTALQRRGEL